MLRHPHLGLLALTAILISSGCGDDSEQSSSSGDGGSGGQGGDTGGGDAGGGDAGGGGGGSDNPGPTVSIVFPAEPSYTDATEITVRGSASDPQGVGSVRVAGVEATSDDGFATWSATVPLGPGTTELLVEATDDGGALSDDTTVPLRWASAIWQAPTVGALSADGKTFYLLDDWLSAVFAVDVATGNRSLLTGPEKGAGPQFAESGPRGIAVDDMRSRVLVSNGSELTAVDLTTGDREIVSDQDVGQGPALSIATFAVQPSQSRAISIGMTYGGLTAIDLLTGDRSPIVTDPPLLAGAGAALSVDDVSGYAYLTAFGSVTRIDLSNGAVTSLGSTPLLAGNAYSRCAVDGAGSTLFLSRAAEPLVRFDLLTGTGQLASVDAGPELGRIEALSFDPATGRVIGNDRHVGAFSYDPQTNASTTVSSPSGRDPDDLAVLTQVSNLAGNAAELLWLTDDGDVFAIKRMTGTISLLADEATYAQVGLSKPFSEATGLGDGALLWFSPEQTLLHVDGSGTPSIVASPLIGDGPSLDLISSLAVDETGSFAIALAGGGATPALVQIDLTTGDRHVVADSTNQPGMALSRTAILLPGGTQALLAKPGGLVTVDMASGATADAAPECTTTFDMLALGATDDTVIGARFSSSVDRTEITLGGGCGSTFSGTNQDPKYAGTNAMWTDSSRSVLYATATGPLTGGESSSSGQIMAIDLLTGSRVYVGP